jgi:ATP-dependent Clp protease ATP-binding subunit ClpA
MVEQPRQPWPVGRFTDRSKRVVAQAVTEAMRLDYGSVEPEHVLLGLIACRSVPPEVGELSAIGLDQARQSVESVLGRGNQRERLDGLSPSVATRRITELAAAEADRLGAARVEPKHVLLGITREPGRAGAVLQALDLSPEAIRSQILGAGR